MSNRTFMLLIFGLHFIFESECVKIAIPIPQKDKFLPEGVFLNNTAYSLYQCMDICYRFNFCKSVNYMIEARVCMLNYLDTTSVATITRTASQYVERNQFIQEFIPTECIGHSCTDDNLCVQSQTCSPWRYIDCGLIEDDNTAIIQYNSTTMLYSTALIQCKRTLPNLNSMATVQCQSSGQWTNPYLQCEDTCFEPPIPRPEAQITFTYNIPGAIYAYYSCDSYPDPSPTSSCPVSRCTAPNTWEPASLSCSANECYNVAADTYTGRVSCTISGRQCQVWNSLFPHFPIFKPIGEGNTNYCRPLDINHAPWCYTTDPAVRWEFCHVPVC